MNLYKDKTIGLFAHVDDAEIFGGGMADECKRIYIAASPMRVDHLRVMEAVGLPRANPWGMVSEYWWKERYLKPEWRENIYTEEAIEEKCRWAVNDQRIYYGVDTLVTHNPWGEYGHIHHRRVSNAVCELAIEMDLTVWASSHVVHIPPEEKEWTQDNCGLVVLPRPYPSVLYNYRRYLYHKWENELPSSLWTWADDMPPPEMQSWIMLVDQGTDKRNGTTLNYANELPVYGL